MLIVVAIWGVAIATFGLARILWIALILLAIAGGADVLSAVFRSSIIQQEVPDRLRGRLSSIQTAVVTGGPRLGNSEAGLAAAIGGNQFSVISGGLGCIVGLAIITAVLPTFRRYEKPPPNPSSSRCPQPDRRSDAGRHETTAARCRRPAADAYWRHGRETQPG